MKISLKLPLAFAAVLLMAAASAAIGIVTLNASVSTYATSVQQANANALAVDALTIGFKGQVQAFKNTLLRGKDPALLDQYWGEFLAGERAVRSQVRSLAASMPADERRSLLDAFAAAHEHAGRRYREGFEAFKASGFDIHVGDSAVNGIDREPVKLLDQLEHRFAALSTETADAAALKARRATLVSVGLLAAVTAAGVAGALLFSRALVRPLRQAMEAMAAVAAGNLSTVIDTRGNDEIAGLMKSLHSMQQSLGRVVAEVRLNADGVSTASTEIAQGNLDLSQRTEAQASALQQTAASMEQVSATVKQNAASAQEASRVALGASGVAQRGSEVVHRVVATMGRINDSSTKIADIISVVDSIAFQTNILALNAAVEAARAGDQGRGFAVVASEVRTLAKRSADAAREVKTLIHTSVEHVQAGSQLVDEAGATMAEIMQSIRRVTDIVGEISSASLEQAAGVSQVGDAITQLDHTTQQNAALVEEGTAAAESLRTQARQLVAAVAAFRHDASAAPAPAARDARAEPAAPPVRRVPRPLSTDAAPAPTTAAPNPAARAARVPAPAPAPAPSVALAAAAAPAAQDAWESF